MENILGTNEIIREVEETGEVATLTYEEFRTDFDFQVCEDSETVELHEEHLLDNPGDKTTYEEFVEMRIDWLLDYIKKGYAVSILGDSYRINI